MTNVPRYLGREPEDVNSEINPPSQDQPLEAGKIYYYVATTLLIEMLAARVNVDAPNALKDIDEVTDLCRELLTSDTPRGHLTNAFETLTQAVLDELSRGKRFECLDQAIGCLRGALNASLPGFHHLSLNLSNLLVVRFLTSQKDDDHREAKAVLYNITRAPSPRAPPDAYQIQASALTSALGLARSLVYSNLRDWEGAVSRCRSFLDNLSNFGHPLHPVIANLLASQAERVSEKFLPPQAVQTPHLEIDHLLFFTQSPVGTFRDGVGSEIVPAPLPMSLEEKIHHLRDHYHTTSPGTDEQRNCLKDLVRCYNDKISQACDKTFIYEAIKYNKRLLATTHPTDKSKFLYIFSFASFLYSAFSLTKSAKYLDDSINLLREVL